MPAVFDAWSIAFATLGFFLALAVGRSLKLPMLAILVAYAIHVVMAFYYVRFVLTSGGDAFSTYYVRSLSQSYLQWKPGTVALIKAVSPFTTTFGVSFSGVSMLFGLAGLVGIYFTLSALLETLGERWRTVGGMLAIFLIAVSPSYHFWSSALGKDSLSILACGLYIWALVRLSRRWPALVAAMLVILVVRPHIALLFVGGIGMLLVQARMSGGARAFALMLIVGFSLVAVPIGLNYAGGIESLEDAQNVIADRSQRNALGGSSYDIQNAHPVTRVFTYALRPLPWEARNLNGLVSSLDNIALLIFLAIAAFRARGRTWELVTARGGMVLYALAGILIFSQATANLGIAIRQKWMFMPALIVGLAWLLASKEERQQQLRRR